VLASTATVAKDRLSPAIAMRRKRYGAPRRLRDCFVAEAVVRLVATAAIPPRRNQSRVRLPPALLLLRCDGKRQRPPSALLLTPASSKPPTGAAEPTHSRGASSWV